MIIEGAFLKLPELLLGHASPEEQYEATVSNYLAMGALLELNARNVPLPMSRIHLDKPYPSVAESRSPGRADLFVDLEGLFPPPASSPHHLYGMRYKNWIEAKFFSGKERRRGIEPRVTNVAGLALDLARLCLYVREDRPHSSGNGRYFVMVFDHEPPEYLAFSRYGGSRLERHWLGGLLSPGQRDIQVHLGGEADSIRKLFGGSLYSFDLNVVVQSFMPSAHWQGTLYSGYLVCINDFTVCGEAGDLRYADARNDNWMELQSRMALALSEGTRFGRRRSRRG